MLEILNISKSFSSQTALADISLTVPQGEFFSLLGPSGCGKSTLLRILAGLEQADFGQIHFAGQRIDQMPIQTRPFNMIFQKYALFPHLSVYDNVAFGLRIKNWSQGEIKDKVSEVLALVGMAEFAQRLPETLSGGQAQRVAIARALVNEPQVLLLDEPLSALDQKMREHMQRELRALQQRLGITFIFVTHDQDEALALSDRIAIMNQGRIEVISTPEKIFEESESEFARHFLGQMSRFDAEVLESEDEDETVLLRIQADQVIRARRPHGLLTTGSRLRAQVRPDSVQIGSWDNERNKKS